MNKKVTHKFLVLYTIMICLMDLYLGYFTSSFVPHEYLDDFKNHHPNVKFDKKNHHH